MSTSLRALIAKSTLFCPLVVLTGTLFGPAFAQAESPNRQCHAGNLVRRPELEVADQPTVTITPLPQCSRCLQPSNLLQQIANIGNILRHKAPQATVVQAPPTLQSPSTAIRTEPPRKNTPESLANDANAISEIVWQHLCKRRKANSVLDKKWPATKKNDKTGRVPYDQKCVSSTQSILQEGYSRHKAEFRRIKNIVFNEALYDDRITTCGREFIGFTWTAMGEAGISEPDVKNHMQGRAEMVAVMRSLRARQNKAEATFIRTKKVGNSPSILDIALDPSQYSMYNVNDPNWVNILLGKKGNKTKATRLRAYRAYLDRVYVDSPKNKTKKTQLEVDTKTGATHYFATYMNPQPNWVEPKKQITGEDARIHIPSPPPKKGEDGYVKSPVGVKDHYYYRGIAQGFNFRHFRGDQ